MTNGARDYHVSPDDEFIRTGVYRRTGLTERGPGLFFGPFLLALAVLPVVFCTMSLGRRSRW